MGVADELLEDPDSSMFIHEYVMRHGGITEATRLLECELSTPTLIDDDVDGDDTCPTFEPSEEIMSV